MSVSFVSEYSRKTRSDRESHQCFSIPILNLPQAIAMDNKKRKETKEDGDPISNLPITNGVQI